jgi:hypothetical protein
VYRNCVTAPLRPGLIFLGTFGAQGWDPIGLKSRCDRTLTPTPLYTLGLQANSCCVTKLLRIEQTSVTACAHTQGGRGERRPVMTFSLKIFSLPLTLLLFAIPSVPALSASQNNVDYALEWHSGHESVAYQFSGVISAAGKPCVNADVELQFLLRDREILQRATTNSEGIYEINLIVEATEGSSAEWKITAKPTESAGAAAEIGGRTVFTEDHAVGIIRTIEISEG